MVTFSLISMANLFVPVAYAYTNDQAATVAIGQESLTTATHSPVSSSSLYEPSGVAFSHGDMIVVDQDDQRILVYQPPFTTGEQATYVIGQQDFTSNGIVGTPNGNDLEYPNSVAVDSAGNIWVSDYANDRILEFTYPFSNYEAASVVIGPSTFTETGYSNPPTASSLQQPTAIAFDSAGDLWVADTFDNRVLEFAPSSSGLFTSAQDGESASLVLGQSAFTTSLASTTPPNEVNGADFYHPEGIAFDSSGNLWVSDIGDARILEFTYPFQNGEAASIVLGQSSLTSTATSGTSASSVSAFGIAFDSSGDLWAADINSNRVLEFVPGAGSCPAGQFCDDMPASLVLGQSSFITSAAGVSATGLYEPTDMAFDGSGNLWVADGGNNRVLEFLSSSTTTTTTTLSTTVTSATTLTQTASTTSTRQQTTTTTSTGLTTTTSTVTSTEPVTATTTVPTTISSATCYDPTVTVTQVSTITAPTTITLTTTSTYLTTNTNTQTATVTSTATDTTTTVVPVTTTQTSLSSTTECGTTVSTSTSGVPQFPGFGATLVILVASLLPLILVFRRTLVRSGSKLLQNYK